MGGTRAGAARRPRLRLGRNSRRAWLANDFATRTVSNQLVAKESPADAQICSPIGAIPREQTSLQSTVACSQRTSSMHVARHLAQEEDQPHHRSHLSQALLPLGSDSPGSEINSLEDIQERILPAVLLNKLICGPWNVDGKTNIAQTDDLQSHEWTIAALQETGCSFSAGGHTARQAPCLFTDRSTTT